MLLISWKSGKFSKKDKKNVKVRHGEYQYVSTPTLTMSEFDPAFLASIRSRILSLSLIALALFAWLSLVVCRCHTDDSSDVTLAFEDDD